MTWFGWALVVLLVSTTALAAMQAPRMVGALRRMGTRRRLRRLQREVDTTAREAVDARRRHAVLREAHEVTVRLGRVHRNPERVAALHRWWWRENPPSAF